MPRTGLLMVSFGEPAEPTPEATIAYLERIFLANASLDADADDGARRRRSRELAERRAPDLLAAYRRIGGSPLNAQAQHQAAYLHNLLVRRGLDTMVSIAMQYTPPTVDEALNEMMVWGAERIVAFPVYPLCGTTTTLAALDAVAQEARRLGFAGPIRGVSGWHADSAYTTARAAHIGREAKAAGYDLRDPDTLLYFSAHGTPLTYIAAGSLYDRYVEAHAREIAARLGARYTIGFQNHGNRRIAWTQPDNDTHLEAVRAARLVVEPISFLHEQSETLFELDIDFRGKAETRGLTMFRVPVPHDDPAIVEALADLVEPLLSALPSSLRVCRCRPVDGTFCTNGEPAPGTTTKT